MAELGISFSCAQPRPNEMEALAEGLALSDWQLNDPMGTFPPRKGADVIRAVLEGREDDISILEWSNLFTQSDWPEIEGRSLDDVCFLLFRAAVKSKPVTNLMLFRAALFLNGGSYFSEVLLAKTHMLSGVVSDVHNLAVTLVVNARDLNFSNLTTEAVLRGLTPFQLFNLGGLSACRELIKQTTLSAIRLASSPVLFEYSPWFAGILKRLTRADQIALVEAIATHGCQSLASETRLIESLRTLCDPSNESSLWYELNTEALKVLTRLLTVSQFFKIRDIARQLEKPEALNLPEMSESTQRSLRNRVLFWSNYQTRLLSVRVLLPESTANFLSRNKNISFWCERMKGGDQTEVLVLEFDDLLIADFLRGPSTDFRLFRKSNRNANLLQTGNINSPDDIRRMYQDDEHDHLLAWQWSAEKLLRTEYSIRVDEGVTSFEGLPEQYGSYTSKQGLPEPNPNILAERNIDLESWWQRFIANEKKLGKYGNDNGSAVGSSQGSNDRQRVLAEARHLKRTGKKRLWRDALEGEARKGDVLALFLLVDGLLLSGRGSHEERIRGEHWYDKLKNRANGGDTAAQEMLKKIK